MERVKTQAGMLQGLPLSKGMIADRMLNFHSFYSYNNNQLTIIPTSVLETDAC